MKIVIFGNHKFSSLAWYVLTHDSSHEIVGFTVDGAYIRETTLHSLPVVAFEQVEQRFPPETIAMIAPLGGRNVNGLREEKHRAGKAKGYQFISYVSSRALTWPDLTIGENCMVYDGAIVQPFAKIGHGVIMRSGSLVSHHADIGNNCFLAAHACVGGGAKIGERCFLGLNSAVRNDVRVAARCVIAAGALVIGDTEENGIYMGVPAKRRPEPANSLKTL
jgi:sugar O-acyltransferase (sialic acid O-acetyltransferase NeuD family)